MEFQDVVHTRRSIRSYLDKPVPREMIDILLKAGMAAPSAGNQQPWHFIVLTDRSRLDAVPEFHPYSAMVRQAPVAILVCGDPQGKKWPDFWPQDVSAATQNILLAARDLGLGSVWVGVYPDRDRMAGFTKLLNIPLSLLPFSFIPLGWPGVEFTAKNRFRAELVHDETWTE